MKHSVLYPCLLLLSVLCATSCREPAVKKVSPRLAVSPVSVSFGEVKVGEVSEQTVSLISQSGAPVTITSVRLDDGAGAAAPAAFELGEPPETVAGLGEAPVVIRFRPSSAGAQRARLLVESNDEEHPVLEVPLDALGTRPILVVAPLCDVAMGCQGSVTVDPPSIDFGEEPFARQIPLPSNALPILEVRNEGDAPLIVTRLMLDGPDAAAFHFEGNVMVPEGGLVIARGTSVNVSLRFTPTSETQLDYAAQVTLESDDGARPSATVALTGKLGPNLPPVVCANITRIENPEDEPIVTYDSEADWAPLLVAPAGGYDFTATRDIRPRGKVTFSALSSATDPRACTADPEDGRLGLTWQWALTQVPVGATGMGLAGANTPTAVLVASGTVTSGDYEITLTVTDAQGHASTTSLKFAVALKKDLVVELSWNQPAGAWANVDLDLHLVRPGSTPFSWFEEGPTQSTSGDVHGLAYVLYLQNEATLGYDFDWGDPGAADDPRFNLDDTGSGPLVELASLNYPGRDASCATTECRYEVWVHHFEDARTHTAPPACAVDGVACKDGEVCTCPGAGERCVADLAPNAAAPSGAGRCLVAPALSVRVFVEGSSTPLAQLPAMGALRLGAPCQAVHVADVIWPGVNAPMPVAPRVEPATGVARFGGRSNQSLSCAPNVPKGGSMQPNWYGPAPL